MHNDIRDVFNAPTRSDAEILLKKLIGKHGKTAPDLSSCLENELPEGVTAFNVEPDTLNARRRLQTTKMVEFQNKELKKTLCSPHFVSQFGLIYSHPYERFFAFSYICVVKLLTCKSAQSTFAPAPLCMNVFTS